MYYEFEWDAEKARTNLKKHGVSFDLAITVFADPYAWSQQDRIENNEYRWQTVGKVNGRLLILVAHTITDKENIELIRVISARPATKKEKQAYERQNSY